MEAFDFSWSGVGFKLKGALKISPDRKWWGVLGVDRPLSNPGVEPGTVEFSNTAGLPGGGTAKYYVPPRAPVPVQPRINTIGDFFSSKVRVEENPVLVEFDSRVTRVGLDAYEYRYTIMNQTNDPLDYAWPDAGLIGVIDPNDSFEHILITQQPPVQVGGTIETTISGNAFEGPSATIRPVPEPLTWVLLSLAAAGCNLIGRRQIAQ